MKKIIFITIIMVSLCFLSKDVLASEIIDIRDTEDTTSTSEEEGWSLTEEQVMQMDPFVTSQEIGNIENVTVENFFSKLYRKMFSTTTWIQKIFSMLMIIFFCGCAVMAVISFFGKNKGQTILYVLGMLLCAVLYFACLEAIPIVHSIQQWWVS